MTAPLFHFLHLVVDTEPRPAAMNMAIDEILLQKAATPTLRSYRWLHPAVSFGYFEKFGGVLKAYAGCEYVRRCTGGGIVPHGNDLTYSLIVPRQFEFCRRDAAEAYRMIHEQIASALSLEGIKADLTSGAHEKTSSACFASPSPHDLMVGENKIAGAAQRRSRFGLLHQGSIQNVTVSAIFAERMAQALSARITNHVLHEEHLEAADALSRAKYASEAWLRKY